MSTALCTSFALSGDFGLRHMKEQSIWCHGALRFGCGPFEAFRVPNTAETDAVWRTVDSPGSSCSFASHGVHLGGPLAQGNRSGAERLDRVLCRKHTYRHHRTLSPTLWSAGFSAVVARISWQGVNIASRRRSPEPHLCPQCRGTRSQDLPTA